MGTTHCCCSSNPAPTKVLHVGKRQQLFPTYCLPMADFLQLQQMETHETMFVSLVKPHGSMPMHFVSHEWLSYKHPDPDVIQLPLMQNIFRKCIAGTAQQMFTPKDWQSFVTGHSAGTATAYRPAERSLVQRREVTAEGLQSETQSGCVWLDYHSIPQDKHQKGSFLDAINSIPNYVDRCDYFWVLAPQAMHADLKEPRNFGTWRSRGWCRLEEVVNLMCSTLTMPLAVLHDNAIATYGFLDGLLYHSVFTERSVANGKFTCCQMNHTIKLPGGREEKIRCDRLSLEPVLDACFQSLFDMEAGEMNVPRKRFLRTFGDKLMNGFEATALRWEIPEDISLEEFMKLFNFKDIDERDRIGWPLGLWVAKCGSMRVVQEYNKRRPGALQGLGQHTTPLLLMMSTRPSSEFREIISFVDSSPARLDDRSLTGFTVIERCAGMGFHGNLRCLLELGGDTEIRRMSDDATALLSAAENGYPLCVQALLDFRADVHAVNNLGEGALHLAARPASILGNVDMRGRIDVLQMLLQARASPNIADNQGRTPIAIATERRFPEAVDVLAKYSSN